MKKNRYWKDVDRVYGQLTDYQLAEQVAKYWGSDVYHEVGKLNRAVDEIKRRSNESNIDCKTTH